VGRICEKGGLVLRRVCKNDEDSGESTEEYQVTGVAQEELKRTIV